MTRNRGSQTLHARALFGQKTGVAALEFALLTPVMTVLLMGLYDIEQGLITFRRVTDAAHQVAMIVTEYSVQPDHSLSITPSQTYQAASAIFATFPNLKQNPSQIPYSVTVSSVAFTSDGQGGYIANTVWSVAISNLSPTTLIADQPTWAPQRACGTLTQIAPNQPINLTNLPTAGMTALAPLAVVDVSYTFKPTFGLFVIGPIVFKRTATLMPRTFQPPAPNAGGNGNNGNGNGNNGNGNGNGNNGNGNGNGNGKGKGAGPGALTQQFIDYDIYSKNDPAICAGF